MADKDENTEIKDMVEKAHELFDDKVQRFDKILALATEKELVDDYIEGYLQLRENGFDFDDAFNTAAEQLDIDVDAVEDEEEEKD